MVLYIDFNKNANSDMTTYSIIGGGAIIKYVTDEVDEAMEFIYRIVDNLDVDKVYIDTSDVGVIIAIGLELRGLNVKKAETCKQASLTTETRTSNASEPNKRIILSRGNLFEIVATISSDTNKKLRGVCLSGGGDISFEDVDGTYYQLSTKDVDTITVKDLK